MSGRAHEKLLKSYAVSRNIVAVRTLVFVRIVISYVAEQEHADHAARRGATLYHLLIISFIMA